MNPEYTIEIYSTESGFEPFSDWFGSLRNSKEKRSIFLRLQRIRQGNFGDCKPIEKGIWEFRFHCRGGYRIYYSVSGKNIILLLCAGGKDSQKKDINQAYKYLEDYKRRNS